MLLPGCCGIGVWSVVVQCGVGFVGGIGLRVRRFRCLGVLGRVSHWYCGGRLGVL